MADSRVKKPSGKSSTPAASTALSSLQCPAWCLAQAVVAVLVAVLLFKVLCILHIPSPCRGCSPSQDIRRCLSDSRPQQVPSGKSSNSRPRLDGCRVGCWTDASRQVTGSDAGEPMTVLERIGVGGHSSQRMAVSPGHDVGYKVGYNIGYSWWMCGGQLTGSGAGGPVAGPEGRSERLKVGPQSVPRRRTVR